jgi:hypothetical protein
MPPPAAVTSIPFSSAVGSPLTFSCENPSSLTHLQTPTHLLPSSASHTTSAHDQAEFRGPQDAQVPLVQQMKTLSSSFSSQSLTTALTADVLAARTASWASLFAKCCRRLGYAYFTSLPLVTVIISFVEQNTVQSYRSAACSGSVFDTLPSYSSTKECCGCCNLFVAF